MDPVGLPILEGYSEVPMLQRHATLPAALSLGLEQFKTGHKEAISVFDYRLWT
jgi:hypothetical protein